MIARSADRQRRTLVLAPPARSTPLPGGGGDMYDEHHASRQATFHDTPGGLPGRGGRVDVAAMRRLGAPEGLVREAERGHKLVLREWPATHTGRHYGGALEHPDKLDGEHQRMVARGWVSVGDSRQNLPNVATQSGQVILEGRLNAAPAKPPLWNEQYAVSDGDVWQYLPMQEVANVLQAKVFPLVVELAPNDNQATDDKALVTKWPEIDDQQVAKHLGYAFQWFAMAVAFFIACLVLLFINPRRNTRRSTRRK